MDERFDAIIIGAGQSGDPLARAIAGSGRSVAIIERDAVGGTCINYGCTPTKTMVASAIVAAIASRSADYGIRLHGVQIDMARVRDRKREIVETWRKSTETRIKEIANLNLIYGEAQFTGPKCVSVKQTDGVERSLTADVIVINTGGRPTIPDIPGLADVPYLDSTSIMELDFVPEHLIVLGGGYVACEFAQMFRRFGSKVTIIQRSSQLLGREDQDVADAVKEIFEEDKIEIVLNANTKAVKSTSNGISVAATVNDNERNIEGSHLLVAVGRSSNIEALHLSVAGVELTQQGFIKVNDGLETSVPGVFATGDVKGGPAFTHISYDDYRVLKKRLLDNDASSSIVGRLVPYTVFIDPQLGRIGLTESEALKTGKRILVAKLPMSYVARAVEMGQTRGFMKVIIENESQLILGCAVFGMEGGEIMAMLEIAMLGKLPYTTLRDAIFAHPTLAESLNNLFLSPAPPQSSDHVLNS